MGGIKGGYGRTERDPTADGYCSAINLDETIVVVNGELKSQNKDRSIKGGKFSTHCDNCTFDPHHEMLYDPKGEQKTLEWRPIANPIKDAATLRCDCKVPDALFKTKASSLDLSMSFVP